MKLLLAEDEKSLSRAIKIILEKNNYLVDAVYDGRGLLNTSRPIPTTGPYSIL